MGMFDNLRKKAEKAVDEHGGQISQGIDKASDAISKKTGGKHDAQIDKGSAVAKDALDKLDGRNDDIPDTKPAGGTAPRKTTGGAG
jgi:hypothetical protein